MYCNKCGAETPKGASFCPMCGAKIIKQTSNEFSVKNTIKQYKLIFQEYMRLFCEKFNRLLRRNSSKQPQKEPQSKVPFYKKPWFWVIVVCLCLGALVTSLEEDLPDDTQAEQTTSQEISLGSDKEHPYVISAEQLANEINRDIKAAKAKYNGKWVKITGKISDTSNGGVVYGYYIYGKKATTGYTGLKIICWCDDGPYSGSVVGDTKTFLGQVREITTFNATEIGDCEIVK